MSKDQREYDEGMNLLDNMLSQLERAGEHVGISDNVFERLENPNRVVEYSIPVKMDDGTVESFTGYRCQHDSARGPYKGGIRYHPGETLPVACDPDISYKGGIRYHPGVSRDEVATPTGWMAWECALVNIPYGGAKEASYATRRRCPTGR